MQKTSCAIMFADISGSTRMYEQSGDETAKKCIDECLTNMALIVEARDGIVIKKIGDELMCRFADANSAINAAKNSQADVLTLRDQQGSELAIRIGIHYGEVIEDDDDIFGDAVNVAARMTDIAKGGQIITTKDTVDLLSTELSHQVRQIDITRVKGKQEKIAVFEVNWEQSVEITKVATQLFARAVRQDARLYLRFGMLFLNLESETESISIGRDSSCDITIDTELASRQHAHCEMRRGKFVITDQGTNGTYVTLSSGEEIYLRREDLVLQGKGVISVGRPRDESNNSELIYYEC